MDGAERRKNVVLNSWKEIASYVGRGVRTVQRWESECGMPIHRPRGHARSAVLAFSDEIDKWLRSDRNPEKAARQQFHNRHVQHLSRAREVIERSVVLREQCLLLCSENEKALNTFLLNMQKLRDSLMETRNTGLSLK